MTRSFARRTELARRPMVALAATLMMASAASGVALMGFGLRSMAQDAPPDPKESAPSASARSQKKAVHKQTPTTKQVAVAPAASTAPTAPAAVANFAGPLETAGAGACATQVNALAGATMGGVASYNTASHWALATPEKRPVSLFIGQKFAAAGVPYAASGVFAAPNGQGGCDGMSVQVVPSPLSCAKLRETLSAHGKQVGDLAGIPLMEEAGSQTMLVPTAADTCVLVGVRTAYAK